MREMTVEQAERIRKDLCLPPNATAEEWADAFQVQPPALVAFATLHAAPIVAERDAARAEVAVLRAAIATGAENAWKWWGACPYCSFGEPGERRHDYDCPANPCPPKDAVPLGECSSCHWLGTQGCRESECPHKPPAEPIMAPLRGIAPDCTGVLGLEEAVMRQRRGVGGSCDHCRHINTPECAVRDLPCWEAKETPLILYGPQKTTACDPGVPTPWVEPPGTAEPPGLRGMNAGGTA